MPMTSAITMARVYVSSPDAHPAHQTRMESVGAFRSTSAGTMSVRRYSHGRSSLKNAVTLIRSVSSSPVYSPGCDSR